MFPLQRGRAKGVWNTAGQGRTGSAGDDSHALILKTVNKSCGCLGRYLILLRARCKQIRICKRVKYAQYHYG